MCFYSYNLPRKLAKQVIWSVTVFFCFFSLFLVVPLETNNPRIYWTDLHKIIKGDRHTQMNDLTFSFRLLKGRCHHNKFGNQISNIGRLHTHSLHCYFKMNGMIAMAMHRDQMETIPLHLAYIW